MKNEVKSAVEFLTNIIKSRDTSFKHTELFYRTLQKMLTVHYRDHWFPDQPSKGSGYRCLRMNHKVDPIIKQAGEYSGLSESQLSSVFPREFTIWIDPHDVSYRIGENGSIGILYSECPNSKQSSAESHQVELESSNSSSGLLTCKDQLMNSLPMSGDSMKRLAAFVYS